MEGQLDKGLLPEEPRGELELLGRAAPATAAAPGDAESAPGAAADVAGEPQASGCSAGCQLATFLLVQLCASLGQMVAMGIFLSTSNFRCFALLLLASGSSSLFCAFAAWRCEAPTVASNVMPLERLWKRRSRAVAGALLVPLGLLQLVTVLLAVDDHCARLSAPPSPSEGGREPRERRRSLGKFHCKAVNGVFEGLLSAFVLLLAFWGCGFPEGHPVINLNFPREPLWLLVCGCAAAASAGLGLLELDFCTSEAVARHIRGNLWRNFVHALFRTSEAVMRISMHVAFIVAVAWRAPSWWWAPLASDVFVTLLLVRVFAGPERSFLVHVLCGVPCVFTNLFLFVDDPTKAKAARRLARWLTAKSVVAAAALPAVVGAVLCTGGDCDAQDLADEFEVQKFWNLGMLAGVLAAVVMHWPLLCYLSCKYQPCERGEQLAAGGQGIQRADNGLCSDMVGPVPRAFFHVDATHLGALGTVREESGSLREANTPANQAQQPNIEEDGRRLLEHLQEICADGTVCPRDPRGWLGRGCILGRGSYGWVYRAADKRDPKSVFAVKVMEVTSAATGLVIQRERNVLAKLRSRPHPCIIGVRHMAHLIEEGVHQFFLEYCPGGTLSDQVKKFKAFFWYSAPASSELWLAQTFLALEHLHWLGILHRDVKPCNVLLDARGVAKLADFGHAYLPTPDRSPGQWSFGDFPPGTPGYVAPEICLGRPHDAKADLYSLGVVAFVLFTGEDAPSKWRRDSDSFRVMQYDNELVADRLRTHYPSQGRQDFILALTQWSPKDRPDHAQVRKLRLMQDLGLPSRGSDGAAPDTAAVEAWLESESYPRTWCGRPRSLGAP